MALWLDYSFARPSLAQMKADGVSGVCRYLSPDDANTHGKILFATEKDSLLNSGFDIALNFEWYQGRCNEGYQAGIQDGQTAFAQAKGLGYPQGKCIYFSHDTGVYDWANIDGYFTGVGAAMGGYYVRGAYGSYDLIGQLHGAGLIQHGWQTTAWSGGRRDPWAQFYQTGEQLYVGAADVDISTGTTLGSWLDSSILDWWDMPIPQADIDSIASRVWGWPFTPGGKNYGTSAHAIIGGIDGVNAVKAATDTLEPSQAAQSAQLTALKTELDSVQADIAALKLTGGQIDLKALAVAVAEEFHNRMAS